ncbi:endolytic transglycosylase MltG [Paludicola sp. MB14-C6]|uniref:endolytic transglycosylase MltG n=1 Tax=Paludihabitans sp. MB14-C6 TaxID=3070656 RepID=UPI0027DE2465|nr:endolytic transglycosylase MltG [Paludicola sp. MB14-C6]WMJ23434.1 endolytic transglycosylase MltG [Paludicola sp. MB14-C6]
MSEEQKNGQEPQQEKDSNQSNNDTQELKDIIKKKESFSLKLDEELNDIPDYSKEEISKPKFKSNTFVKVMSALIIIGIAVLLSITIIFAAQDIYGMGKQDRSITIDIPEKAGVIGIADILEDTGVINSSFFFKVYYKLSKQTGSMNYGRYELNSNMSYQNIIDNLAKYSATKEEVQVTIPEGFTIYQIAKRLQEKEVCKSSDFISALNKNSYGFEFEKEFTKNTLRYHKYEGYVFPETYKFYKNDNPQNVAKKMLGEFNKRVTQEMRDKMKQMGYTFEQAMTIASIVQKEAGKTSEMQKVASVYHNRLSNKGVYPNLQACPTRDYANELKVQMDVLNKDVIDAYNTYEAAGLPPGPICNPGLDAIEATLNPEKTDYYFFCTNLKTKEFYYAKTLKEHERNIYKAGLR